MAERLYSLPPLPYSYDALAPHMSEEQLRLHHDKHHKAYVDGANSILAQLDAARKEGKDIDMRCLLKSLSFNVGGHILHSLFWENLSPKQVELKGELAEAIQLEFGSLERFRKEFMQAATSAEGSAWAALALCNTKDRLLIMQIEKHNVNIYPDFSILMVLDLWEHAYYIDYRNDKAKFAEALWKIINWAEVEKRFRQALKR